MANWQVQFLSEWAQVNGRNVMEASLLYGGGDNRFVDVSHTGAQSLLPTPNVVCVDAVVDALTYALIDANEAVISAEEVIDVE